jgi:uncharacterized membrane protein/thiol-disulfide isomerase/thioredoxin
MLFALSVGLARPTLAGDAVVRAVLFYSPTCPHCYQVITEDLPPLFEKYGDQLQIAGVDTTTPDGQALYQAAIQRFSIPPERLGVPTLIVGDVVLVGSLEIPQQFPGLIEKYLAQGGVDWPDIPGLAEALAAAQPTPTVTSAPTAIAAPASTSTIAPSAATPSLAPTLTATAPGLILDSDPPADLSARLARDPAGNTLAIVVLIGMVFSVALVTARLRGPIDPPMTARREWAIPALCLIGFVVAGYLSYVETTQIEAVCGPIGDCNTVQQSEYARLFGLIPIGVLGLVGYVAIGIAWVVRRYHRGRFADLAGRALFGMTVFGTLFSIYLTFLEPFVIGATCAWCLASAVIMTALMWLTAVSGRPVIVGNRGR